LTGLITMVELLYNDHNIYYSAYVPLSVLFLQ
jgi:hypothetical protein